MFQAFAIPGLMRNHFTEANLLRFPHCLASLCPGTTHLCFPPASHMGLGRHMDAQYSYYTMGRREVKPNNPIYQIQLGKL